MHMSLHLYSHICAHDSRQPSQNVCVMRMCSICQMLQSFSKWIFLRAGPKRSSAVFSGCLPDVPRSSQLNMVWFSVFCWLNSRKPVQGGGAIFQLRTKQIGVWSSISERSDPTITSSLHQALLLFTFLLERWKEDPSQVFLTLTIHYFISSSHFRL